MLRLWSARLAGPGDKKRGRLTPVPPRASGMMCRDASKPHPPLPHEVARSLEEMMDSLEVVNPFAPSQWLAAAPSFALG